MDGEVQAALYHHGARHLIAERGIFLGGAYREASVGRGFPLEMVFGTSGTADLDFSFPTPSRSSARSS